MNIEEMLGLQGIDPDTFVRVVPDSVLGQQIGNAMGVNVVERTFSRALVAAGLVKKSCLKDSKQDLSRWKSGVGLEAIRPRILSCDRRWTTKIIVQEPKREVRHIRSVRKLLVDSGATFHSVNAADLMRKLWVEVSC